MKSKALSFLLAAVMAFGGIRSFETRAQAQAAPAVFVLTATCAGLILIFFITKKHGEPATHTFVLQKRVEVAAGIYYWKDVATNSFRMPTNVVFEAFYTWVYQSTNQAYAHMFRIREIPWPYNESEFMPQQLLVLGGPEAQPILHDQ